MPRFPTVIARGALVAFLSAPLLALAEPAAKRVIVLGFDGADARTTAELMDAGELPNLAKLRASGTFAPLGTTVPAESPVSWASLDSGQNPAKTGIPGFIKRDLADGMPVPAAGNVLHESRDSEKLQLSRWARLAVTTSPWVLAGAATALVALVFFGVIAGLLRIRKGVAAALSLVLGAVGGAGAWLASGQLPHRISDVVVNPTKTPAYWDVAARSGVRSVVLDGAMAWDQPDEQNLELLAGLGVPDVRGSNGDWFLYTTADKYVDRAPTGKNTPTAGKVFRVDERDGRIESSVYGPYDFLAIDRANREIADIEAQLAKPGLGDARAAKLEDRKREIEQDVLPRLECRGSQYGDSEEGRLALPLVVTKEDGKAVVTIGSQTQRIAPGQWSGWYHLTFESSPLFKVHAITRARLVSLADPFELFVDFLQIDPEAPLFWQPVSRPAGFARELARSIHEPYETVGWACLTMPFKDRQIDPATFLSDIELTNGWRVKLARAALAREDWRLLVDVESTPDRVQHMMYQYRDKSHPLYDAAKAAQRVTYFGRAMPLSDVIPATYRQMDQFVGEVLEKHVRPGDTLIVCADHGFQSFRRQVHLNNWLAREGYLVVRDDATSVDRHTLAFVDWSRTRAYALGLGGIYLNLAGREREGIVKPADATALIEEIRAKLLALEDEGPNGTRSKAVHDVYRIDAIHSGPHLDQEADLFAGFAAGWRVSWATSLGDTVLVEKPDKSGWVAGPVFDDNKLNWSGDHVSVAADLVPGIFFSNRKVKLPPGGIDLLAIAPTVLHELGVAVPAEYDRAPLVLE